MIWFHIFWKMSASKLLVLWFFWVLVNIVVLSSLIYVKWNKPDTEKNILHVFLHMWELYKEKSFFIFFECRIVIESVKEGNRGSEGNRRQISIRQKKGPSVPQHCGQDVPESASLPYTFWTNRKEKLQDVKIPSQWWRERAEIPGAHQNEPSLISSLPSLSPTFTNLC